MVPGALRVVAEVDPIPQFARRGPFDDQIRQYLPPRNRPSYLRGLIHSLEAPPAGKTTDLGPPLQRLAQMLTKRGMIVLISDLLTSVDRLEPDLGYLRAGGHDVVVFHILDPAELNFEFDAPALFHDVETGRDLYVDPSAARKTSRTRRPASSAAAKALPHFRR